MQTNIRKSFLNIFFTAWLISSILVFLYVNRIGFVQIVNITNWDAFVDTLIHISPWDYLFDLVWSLLRVLLFSMSCLSLGLFILQKWNPPSSSNLALGVTAFIIGEIAFSLFFLTVIRLYHLTPAIVAISLLIGFLIGFTIIKNFYTTLQFRSLPRTSLKSYEGVFWILILAGLILSLMLSATRLGYDASADYFSHAKIMAVSQSPIFFHPNYPFIVSEFHPGILFTALIQIFGDQSARMVPWMNGIAILLLGVAFGKELGFTSRTSLWFLVLMFSTTAFMDLFGDGKVELISTAPIIAGVYWLHQSIEKPTKSTSTVIGSLLGFAIISRQYNIFLVSCFVGLCIGISMLAQHRSGQFKWKDTISNLFWLMLPILALAIFHLIHNWLWLNNPFAPLIYARKIDSSKWQWQFDPTDLTLYRIFYPITLTFMNSPQSLGNISPLFISVLPLLLLKNIRQGLHIHYRMLWILLSALLTLVTWLVLSFTVVEIRYVFFIWVIFFLAVAPLLERVSQQLGLYVYPIVLIFLSIMCIRIILLSVIAYYPLNEKNQSHCADNQLCSFMETVSQSAAPGDRVLALHAYRYYLRPDLFACSSQVSEYTELEKLAGQNSPDFWSEVYRRGFKFIIYEKHLSEDRYQFGKLPSPIIAPGWMDIKLLYTNSNGTQKIYKIEAFNPPIQPEISCALNSAGIWQVTTLNSSDQ